MKIKFENKTKQQQQQQKQISNIKKNIIDEINILTLIINCELLNKHENGNNEKKQIIIKNTTLGITNITITQ